MPDKSTNPRFFYGHVVTAAGFGVWLICWGTFNPCFGVFLKPLLAEFGWTRAETALAYSLALSVQAVLTIMMGWLTDRLGPRTVVTVFGSFLGICYVLMSGVSTIWQFQLNYGLVGAVGLSALNIPIMVTIARWFVKRRGLMIGIVQAGLGIGGLIFPPFTAWLILDPGPHHPRRYYHIRAFSQARPKGYGAGTGWSKRCNGTGPEAGNSGLGAFPSGGNSHSSFLDDGGNIFQLWIL
jgi:MFS family permease